MGEEASKVNNSMTRDKVNIIYYRRRIDGKCLVQKLSISQICTNSEILNIDFLSQMPTCLSKYLPVYNNVKISTCLLPCLGVYLCLKD